MMELSEHTKVRHVPEMKKNLISIGIMDGRGSNAALKMGS